MSDLSRHPSFDAENRSPAKRLPGQDSKGDSSVQVGRFFLENRFLRIDVHPNGTIAVHDKERDCRYRGLHLFEDGGDIGNPGRYCPPAHDRKIVSRSFPARLSFIESEPAIRIRVRMKVPACVLKDRQTRSAKKGLIKLWSAIRLEADSRILAFETVIDNQADDHRLKALFPTDCDPRTCRAATFLSKTEQNPVPSDATGTPPLTGLVTVQDQRRSISLLTQGLDDYELKLDNRRTLCLTLLRSVGSDLREERQIGTSFKIPESQRRGRHLFRYGLYFHPESIQSH